MQIELIDKLHLKVELSENDMNLFSIDREMFAQKDEHAKNVLKAILKNAYEQTGFDIFNARMLVEIFPVSDIGCIILFTKSPNTSKKRFRVSTMKNPLVFEFLNTDFLMDCAAALADKSDLGENLLYEYNNKFYLVFLQSFKLNKCAELILSEYGSIKNKKLCLILKEHAKMICDKDAVKKLGIAELKRMC